jgi:D-aminoacyl-tRNA deacylase
MMVQTSQTIVLVASSKDLASMNMAEKLREKHHFFSTKVTFLGRPVFQKDSILLATVDTELVNPPDLDVYFNPQAYVFLSRHRSESGVPAVTAHTTGNFSNVASLGGRPREIGRNNPDLLKNYMLALKKRAAKLDGYRITIEATHHGPTSLQKAVLFIEIGSKETNWKDENASEIVVDALMESLMNQTSWDKVAIGFGGTHYPEKFNKLLIESDVALASIAAKYSLENIDSENFGQMIQKSTKYPRYIAVDWKGMGKHKGKILKLAQQFALDVIRL